MKIDNDDEQEVQVIAPTVQAATTAGVGGRGRGRRVEPVDINHSIQICEIETPSPSNRHINLVS